MRYLLSILLFIPLFVSAQLREPFLRYTFDNTLIDSTLSGNNLKKYDNTTFSSTYKVVGSHSVQLDGVNDYLTIPPADWGNEFFVSLWVRFNSSITAYRQLLCGADAAFDSLWFVRGVATNTIKMYTDANSVNPGVTTSEAVFHHLVVYFNKSGIGRMWHDGVKVATTDSSLNTYFDSKDSVYIGIDQYKNADFAGNIDELLVYKGFAPSESQIDSLYNRDYLDPIGGGGSYNPSQFIPSNSYIGRSIPTYNGQIKSMTHKRITAPLPLDTIQYLLSLDFENAWTSTTVQSKDSMERRLPMSWFNHYPAQHTIVDVGGTHNHVWQAMMPANQKQGFQNFIHLGDTAKELYYQLDLYVQSNFNKVATNGLSSGKFPGGFKMGNQLITTDTITTAGKGGQAHNVWGSGATDMMLYVYSQNYAGYALGSWGTWAIPKGYWQTKTIRVNVGDPGQDNGFAEMFIDGTLVAQATGLKFRSVAQGEDFGKIEALWNSYQFGGEGDYLSPQDQYIRMDNKLVYRLKPGATGYVKGLSPAGHKIPVRDLPQSELTPPYRLEDETYTAVSDTIFDVGNNIDYIYNPPNKREPIYKTVNVLPGGNLSFRFLREEFGYDGPGSTYVKVYSGTKTGTLKYTFGLVADGRLDPSGTYTITSPIGNIVTFEIYIGYSNYATRGIAIEYTQ